MGAEESEEPPSELLLRMQRVMDLIDRGQYADAKRHAENTFEHVQKAEETERLLIDKALKLHAEHTALQEEHAKLQDENARLKGRFPAAAAEAELDQILLAVHEVPEEDKSIPERTGLSREKVAYCMRKLRGQLLIAMNMEHWSGNNHFILPKGHDRLFEKGLIQ